MRTEQKIKIVEAVLGIALSHSQKLVLKMLFDDTREETESSNIPLNEQEIRALKIAAMREPPIPGRII